MNDAWSNGILHKMNDYTVGVDLSLAIMILILENIFTLLMEILNLVYYTEVIWFLFLLIEVEMWNNFQ